MTASQDIHVEAKSVEKHFGGVRALKSVSIQIRRGEVHALIGENGAGKSTLGKIIAGALRHDTGELLVNGEARTYRAPYEAIRDGIAIIDQELALLPMRSVIDNVFLGTEFATRGILRSRQARESFDALIKETGFQLEPGRLVGTLRLADQQKVEILRALARRAELIVMDEPSAALTPVEVAQLHAIVRSLQARGTTVVIASHFLEEVLAISDRVSILRDGRFIRTAESAAETVTSLVQSMLGAAHAEELEARLVPEFDAQEQHEVLRIEGLTRPGVIEDVSFAIRSGEIVGLSGLVGSGRTEVCRAIFGADHSTGTVTLNGEARVFRSPAQAIRAGLALLPESRKDYGLVMGRSVRENMGLAHLRKYSKFGVLQSKREREATMAMGSRVGIKYGSVDAGVHTLSGGNQQKVVLSRWLLDTPQVLIVDEPTRGVDVGARAAAGLRRFRLPRSQRRGALLQLASSSGAGWSPGTTSWR